jgi:hypothetical protein
MDTLLGSTSRLNLAPGMRLTFPLDRSCTPVTELEVTVDLTPTVWTLRLLRAGAGGPPRAEPVGINCAEDGDRGECDHHL